MDTQSDTGKLEQREIAHLENSVYVHGVNETVGVILLAIIAFFLILTLRRERKENQKLLRDLVRIIDKKQK
jgi:hypothetical protein